jgi:hypothetical protein
VSRHAVERSVSGVQDEPFGVYGVGSVGVRDEKGVDSVDRPVAAGGVCGMVSVSELDRAGVSGLEAVGMVVSSDAGSGRGAFGACVVGVGGGGFVGVVVWDGCGRGASCMGCVVGEAASCSECVSDGLVVGVVGGFGVCGWVA